MRSEDAPRRSGTRDRYEWFHWKTAPGVLMTRFGRRVSVRPGQRVRGRETESGWSVLRVSRRTYH